MSDLLGSKLGTGLGQRLWPGVGHGVPLIGVAVIAAFNGSLFSPVFDSVAYYVSSFSRGSYLDGLARTMLSSSDLYVNLTRIFIALMTLLLAGIPAALYERIRGLKASTPVSLGIWLVAAVLLSMPTIMKVIGGDDF